MKVKARGRLGAQEQNGAEEQARINLSTVAPEDYLFSVALLGLRHCELEPAALPAPLQQVTADLVNQSQAQEETFFALVINLKSPTPLSYGFLGVVVTSQF